MNCRINLFLDAKPLAEKKFKKDPKANTSFLPDKVRAEQEKAERLRLKNEWLEAQEKIKSTAIANFNV